MTTPDLTAAAQTPLLDLLRSVPADARMIYEHSPTHSQSIPVGRLCAEAAAALAAQQAGPPDGWRPIETAPKDSKARLVWVPEIRCTFCVTWTEGNCEPGEEGDPPGWVIFGGGYRSYLLEETPTHWMPLPAGPAAAPEPPVERAAEPVDEQVPVLMRAVRLAWAGDHAGAARYVELAAERSEAESPTTARALRSMLDALVNGTPEATVHAAQAAPVAGEPVAWVNAANLISAKISRERGGPFDQYVWREQRSDYHNTPLYAAPPAHAPVPPMLTEEERAELQLLYGWDVVPSARAAQDRLIRAVEAAVRRQFGA